MPMIRTVAAWLLLHSFAYSPEAVAGPYLPTCTSGAISQVRLGDGICDPDFNCLTYGFDDGDCIQNGSVSTDVVIGEPSDITALAPIREIRGNLSIVAQPGASVSVSLSLPNLESVHHLNIRHDASDWLVSIDLPALEHARELSFMDGRTPGITNVPLLQRVNGTLQLPNHRESS